MGSRPALEKFFQIRAEKQKHILGAAFAVFGKQGYRKASIADIAKEAGTTKGMITYYFGSKKTLYLFLVDLIQSASVEAIESQLTPDVTDFFEKLKKMVAIQVEAIKEYPAIISFANSTYYEKDPEVAGELEQLITAGDAKANQLLMEVTDFSWLKPGFDLQVFRQLILWVNNGFVEELCSPGGADKIDDLAAQFCKCLDMLKQVFYK